MKCQVCKPNFVGEREKGKGRKKTHEHVILLGSIK